MTKSLHVWAEERVPEEGGKKWKVESGKWKVEKSGRNVAFFVYFVKIAKYICTIQKKAVSLRANYGYILFVHTDSSIVRAS